MWRCRYRPLWVEHNGCILIIMRPKVEEPFGLRPIGPGNKIEALKTLTEELKALDIQPRIARACKSFVEKFVDRRAFKVVADRDNSDYVYPVGEFNQPSR